MLLAQLLLFALGNVSDHTHQIFFAFEPQDRGVHLYRHLITILAYHYFFAMLAGLALLLLFLLLFNLAVILMDEICHNQVQQFAPGIAEHFAGLGVDVHDVAVEGLQEHGIVGAFYQSSIALLRIFECLFCLFSLSNVF